VLNILREYKSSFFTAHSGVVPNFGPNHNSGHFVDDTLHHSQLDFSFLQPYVPQTQHSLDLNTASFGNHPLELDQQNTDYTGTFKYAAYLETLTLVIAVRLSQRPHGVPESPYSI
jgi:hypothetical protein